MAITEWYPQVETPGVVSWVDRLRSFAYRWLAYWDIRRETLHMQRIAASEAAQERKRAKRIELEARKADNIKRASMRREMRLMERAISMRLTALEFAHWTKPVRGRYKISRIRFAQRVATPSRIFLRLDTARLPRGRGITTQNLMEQEILDELSLACHAPVSYERHYERGFWYIVDLGGKLSAIPSIVERREAVEQMPVSASPLDVPFGIGNYRRFYHIDLEKAPHMIVAGATGFGKSIFIHNILTYILEHTTPDQVRLALADLKGGAEMGRYVGVPHLWERGGALPVEARVYSKRDEVLDMLKAVLYEVEWRLQLFAEERVSNLTSWNQKHHARRLPRLLVVVDEIQNAMLDSKSRGEMESTLVDIASRARASGIHVIIATQRPSVDVITGLIKANFPSRVAFNCFSIHDSKTILDTTEAANLGRPGLLVFRGLGDHHFRCQSPWLTEGLIEEIITNAIAGTGATTTKRSVGIPDLIGWAINENGGRFSVDDIYQQFRPQGITYQEIRNIAVQFGVHDKLIEHGEKFYKYRKRDSMFIEVDANGTPVGAVTIEALLRWSLQRDGEFGINQIYEAFRSDLTKKQVIEFCHLYDKKQVELDGITYRLEPGNNHKSRRWVVME